MQPSDQNTAPKTPTPEHESSFEDQLQALEATVRKMESGNLGLEAMLALYEKGMQLSASCDQTLKQAEMRIRIISESGQANDGSHLLETATDSTGE